MKRSDTVRALEVTAMRDIAVAALSNPVVTLVGGVIMVSAAEKAGIVSPSWAKALEGGVFGVATMQALAPITEKGGLSAALLALGAGATAGGLAAEGSKILAGPSGALGLLEGGKGGFWNDLKKLALGIFS